MRARSLGETGTDVLKQLIELFGTLGGVAVGLAYLMFEQAMINSDQFVYIICAAVVGEGIGGGMRIVGGVVSEAMSDTVKALKSHTIQQHPTRKCDCENKTGTD